MLRFQIAQSVEILTHTVEGPHTHQRFYDFAVLRSFLFYDSLHSGFALEWVTYL